MPFDSGAVSYLPPFITSGGNYSGSRFFPISIGGSGAVATLGNGNLRLGVGFIEQCTIQSWGSEVTSVGDAGCTIHFGIYNDTGFGYPGALLKDLGTIPGDSIGTPEVALASNLTIPTGWYWIGGAVQGVTVTQPTVRSTANPNVIPGFVFQIAGVPGAGTTACGYNTTGITAALPLTFPAFSIGNNIGVSPRLWFRYA